MECNDETGCQDVVVFNSAILGYERSRHWRLASLGAKPWSQAMCEPTREFSNWWMSCYGFGNLYAPSSWSLHMKFGV
jgi:hypothetical protein